MIARPSDDFSRYPAWMSTPAGSGPRRHEPPRSRPSAPTTFVSELYGRGRSVALPSGRGSGRGSSGARLGRPQRLRRGVGILVGVWLLFLAVVAVLSYARIDRVDATPSGNRPPDGPGTNFLLVGSDSRGELTEEQSARFGTGQAEGKRTDTILLLHVPGRGDAAPTLVSFPRDSYVPIPGHDRNKINAAYALGGPELLTQTIEEVSGIHINGYVEIGFGGFAAIVDAVGGVDICLDKPMKDPMANLDLPAGCQSLDGGQSLGFVRTRASAGGDLDRVERQQQFLGLLADEIVSPWTILNPVRYTRTLISTADALTVGKNNGPIDLARFAWGMRQATGPGGQQVTVPVEGTPTIAGIGSVVDWDNDAAVALFEAIQNDTAFSVKGN
jgi:LCP family protein required for cell wall assembly